MSVLRALTLVCLLLGCSKQLKEPDPKPVPSAMPSPPGSEVPVIEPPLSAPDAGVTALLSGLKAGDELGSAKVVEVFGVSEGRIPIHVMSGTSHGWLEISLRSEEPPPPVSTNHYSVYWTMRGANVTDRMNDEAVLEVALKLGERLRSVEDRVAQPSGMQKFPKPQPTPL
jgi:hypothetical protein